MSTHLVGFMLSVMSADRLAAPAPIDPRAPRLNQGVLTVALLAGFLTDWRPVIPIFAVVLLLGAALGPRYGPVLRFFAVVIRPRLQPPAEMEDPRPPRFAAAIGVAFLGAASLALVIGAPGVAWTLSLIVAALAGLAAVTGLCIGCEAYVVLARRRGVAVSA
jgi:cytosine/uracil/thiamine/allantoin permease